jgi:outer membrane protein OmpA-like peptidoglycan-associated protein
MSPARTSVAVILAGGIGLMGCTNPDGTTNNTNTGVLLGGTLGAATGALVSGDNRKGAVIGGILGATAGGVIGNQLDKQQAELQAEIGGSGARIINTGDRLIVVMPEAITFDIDSATVRNSIRDELAAVARSLLNYPNTSVQVIGHTDNTGTAAYNQSLSERRANAVSSILIGNGVQSARIVAYGRGESQPIASNSTPEGRQQNRRVEIVITPNG